MRKIRSTRQAAVLIAALALSGCSSMFSAATDEGVDTGQLSNDGIITDTIDGGSDYLPIEEGGVIEIPVGSAKAVDDVYLNIAAVEYDFQSSDDTDVALLLSRILPVGLAHAEDDEDAQESEFGTFTVRCSGLCASSDENDFENEGASINNPDLELYEIVVTNESTGGVKSTTLRADGTFPDIAQDGNSGDSFDIAVRTVGGQDLHSWVNVILGHHGQVQIGLTFSPTQKYTYEMARATQKVFFIAEDSVSGLYTFKSIPQRGGVETEYFHLAARPVQFQVSPDGNWLIYGPEGNSVLIYDAVAGKVFEAAPEADTSRAIDVGNSHLAFTSVVVLQDEEIGSKVKLSPFIPQGGKRRGKRHQAGLPPPKDIGSGLKISVVMVQPMVPAAEDPAGAIQHEVRLGAIFTAVNVQFNESGDRLYILAKDDGGTRVYRYTLATQELWLITTIDRKPDDMYFDLADDETKLVFTADVDGIKQQVHELDLQSLTLKLLTHHQGIAFALPHLLPNGSAILAQGHMVGELESDGSAGSGEERQEIFQIDRFSGLLTALTEAYEDAWDPQTTADSNFGLYKSIDKNGYLQINLLPLE